jgi:hypothetical protein
MTSSSWLVKNYPEGYISGSTREDLRIPRMAAICPVKALSRDRVDHVGMAAPGKDDEPAPRDVSDQRLIVKDQRVGSQLPPRQA